MRTADSNNISIVIIRYLLETNFRLLTPQLRALCQNEKVEILNFPNQEEYLNKGLEFIMLSYY